MWYWEKNVELDLVRTPDHPSKDCDIIVSEVKFKKLLAGEKSALLGDLKQRWALSELSKRYLQPHFEVLESSILGG